MTHEDLWRALDTLAAEKGLSSSGLARAAGLDPTSFNRSKRIGRNGPRWPSTESLSRVLAATGASLEEFAALVGGARVLPPTRSRPARMLPSMALSTLAAGVFDRHGHPAGTDWQTRAMPPDWPAPADPHAYAIRVDAAGFEPAFREDGIVVVSPEAAIRPGDRVVALLGDRATIRVVRETLGAPPALMPLDPIGIPDEREARLLHRIVWASL